VLDHTNLSFIYEDVLSPGPNSDGEFVCVSLATVVYIGVLVCVCVTVCLCLTYVIRIVYTQSGVGQCQCTVNSLSLSTVPLKYDCTVNDNNYIIADHVYLLSISNTLLVIRRVSCRLDYCNSLLSISLMTSVHRMLYLMMK